MKNIQAGKKSIPLSAHPGASLIIKWSGIIVRERNEIRAKAFRNADNLFLLYSSQYLFIFNFSNFKISRLI